MIFNTFWTYCWNFFG